MVNNTSLLAYLQLDDIKTRREQVFHIIKRCEPITNLQISKILQLPINSITGRTRELVQKGLVESKGTTTIQYSKKVVRVHNWGVVDGC